MAAAVERLGPKGKTSLSAALRRAADERALTEAKATVVLISDGLVEHGRLPGR